MPLLKTHNLLGESLPQLQHEKECSAVHDHHDGHHAKILPLGPGCAIVQRVEHLHINQPHSPNSAAVSTGAHHESTDSLMDTPQQGANPICSLPRKPQYQGSGRCAWHSAGSCGLHHSMEPQNHARHAVGGSGRSIGTHAAVAAARREGEVRTATPLIVQSSSGHPSGCSVQGQSQPSVSSNSLSIMPWIPYVWYPM